MGPVKYNCVDLFAGAGGLTYGLSQSGFISKIGVEYDVSAAKTLKSNNPETSVVVEDIRKLDPIQVIETHEMIKEDIDIIVGGPPCRGFSVSNTRTRNSENPLNSLYQSYLEFINKIRPRIFVFENVEGFISYNGGKVLDDLIKKTSSFGYHTSYKLINAEKYGVPQKRKRVIIIGSDHQYNDFFDLPQKRKVKVKEAISDLPHVKNGNRIDSLPYKKNSNLSDFQVKMRTSQHQTVSNNQLTKNGELVLKRYSYIPQGGNWRNIPDEYMQNYANKDNCHSGIYHRLIWEDTSKTISNYRKNMLIHPLEDRGLSVREVARLQSFPDNYIFSGSLGSQQQQVANAVPPIIGTLIGNNIWKYLYEH